jgi:hypothetical protein
MPCVRFEPTIPASEQAKTVPFLDRSATLGYRDRLIHILASMYIQAELPSLLYEHGTSPVNAKIWAYNNHSRNNTQIKNVCSMK